MNEEVRKKALARLEKTGRKCDGCGTRIGRFTDQCHYDEAFDRVYCSTGGCAKKFSVAPFCSGCGSAVNPFELEGCTVIPKAGANEVYCRSCTEGVGESSRDTTTTEESNTQPQKATKSRRRSGGKKSDRDTIQYLSSLQKRILVEDEEPTSEERKAAEEGPYQVVQIRPDWYQVKLADFVRSAVGSENRAIKLCARFNRAA